MEPLKLLAVRHPILARCRRCCMTYARALKSLKPLLQAIHPDLFEAQPKLQAVNVASLQRLHLLLSDLSQGRVVHGSRHDFRFYLKRGTEAATTLSVTSSGSLGDSVQQILGQLGSPAATEGVDQPLPPSAPPGSPAGPRGSPDLASWLASVAPDARAKLAHSRQIADSCARLETVLLNRTGAASIRWQSDWTLGHYLRSLSALETLLSTRPGLAERLRGRSILFAPGKTGLGLLDGNRLLNPADVPEAWLSALLPDQSTVQPQLDRVAALERAVSVLLHGARLVRHPGVHLSVTLAEYEACLSRLLSGLAGLYRRLYSDRRFRMSFGRLDLTAGYDLAGLTVAVEDSSGHVTLPQRPDSPVICPARNPAFQLLEALIDLAAGRDPTARERQLGDSGRTMNSGASAPMDWGIVAELSEQCVLKHRLDNVSVDSSLSAADAANCLERLLRLSLSETDLLRDLSVRVTRFRSVLDSGEICIMAGDV